MASSQELLLGTGTAVNAFQIQRSLRFNSADSAYLSRTPASAGNRKTWTVSLWFKRSSIGPRGFILGNSDASGNNGLYVEFPNGEYLRVGEYGTSSFTWILNSTPVYRDPSAWYHLVIAVDTTQSTSANSVKVYINNVQITAWATTSYPSQNSDTYWNNNQAASIGRPGAYVGLYFDGYITNVDNIDGQQLTPSSFGETNADTGVWQPKAYSGTYGTNGFQLLFADNSGTTSTTLGKDTSGNGNNWTPNNFSVTAGAGNDSLVDTPTPYGTDTGAGGEVRGNYATWNPLDIKGSMTFVNGNLDCSYNSTAWANTKGTISMASGKWYFEVTPLATWNFGMVGVYATPVALPALGSYIGSSASCWAYQTRGGIWNNDVETTSGISAANSGDIMMIAVDIDAGKIWFGRNGTWFNSGAPASGSNPAYSNLSGPMSPAASVYDNASGFAANFGQRPFAYTAPSGFKALCTQNLPTPTIGATNATQANDYFNTVLYTGDGSNRSITGIGFQPDFVWLKSRSAFRGHALYDAVRGATKILESQSTNPEGTESTGLTAFVSDGFSLGTSTQTNDNAATYVAWNWKANGAGSANTAGSISSTVSANTTAGFSVVTFSTNSSSGNATVGHGLGVAPAMILMKSRNAAYNWDVFHSAISNAKDGRLILNSANAFTTASVPWGGTNPTSTVFTMSQSFYGTGIDTVAYCFAPVSGYSAFGSYEGNNSSDGPFVYLGFRPRYLLIKSSTLNGYEWTILDTARTPYNVMNGYLIADGSNTQATGFNQIDIVSNGFKIRQSAGNINPSGGTLIYAAFAENPFKYSLAR